MNKILKASALVFLGLLIWICGIYIALAFLKAELNPFVWSQGIRGDMLLCISFYFAFIPLMISELKHWI
jgi:uncharacterized membrane protein